MSTELLQAPVQHEQLPAPHEDVGDRPRTPEELQSHERAEAFAQAWEDEKELLAHDMIQTMDDHAALNKVEDVRAKRKDALKLHN